MPFVIFITIFLNILRLPINWSNTETHHYSSRASYTNQAPASPKASSKAIASSAPAPPKHMQFPKLATYFLPLLPVLFLLSRMTSPVLPAWSTPTLPTRSSSDVTSSVKPPLSIGLQFLRRCVHRPIIDLILPCYNSLFAELSLPID